MNGRAPRSNSSCAAIHLAKDRAREGPAEFLRDYGGILQCDGYQGYEKMESHDLLFMVEGRKCLILAIKSCGLRHFFAPPQFRPCSRQLQPIHQRRKLCRTDGHLRHPRHLLRPVKATPG